MVVIIESLNIVYIAWKTNDKFNYRKAVLD